MKKIEVVLQSQIERKSGLKIGQLRKWRQRYGFPPSELGPQGLAIYSIETVDKLVLIRRLLEAGFKPSDVVRKSSEDLKKLILEISDHRPAAKRSELTQKLIEILKQSDIEEFHSILKNDRAQKTIFEFCQKTIAPLMTSIGDAWANNEIDVYHEHLCTTIVERFLIGETLKNNPKISYPIFLFALPPKEFHQLGLLMVESIIAEHGAWIINIGADVPLFSLYPKRDVLPVLKQMRRLLPVHIQLWAGGSGLRFLRKTPKGIKNIPDLSGVVSAFLDLKPVH